MKRVFVFTILLSIVCLMIGIVQNKLNAQSNFIDTMKATQKIIDVATATQTYVGEAHTLANTNQSVWRIYRVASNGNITYIQYAGYSVEFDKAWSLRTTYNYGLNP